MTFVTILHLLGIAAYISHSFAAPLFFSRSDNANATTPSLPTNSTLDTSNSTNTEPPIPLRNATDLLGIPDVLLELRRSAEFTNAAYCSSKTVQEWACGPTCDALGNITVLYTNGTNQLIPDYYIAYDPSTESIVLSQQGTDPTQILSLLVDADVGLDALNSTYFPNSSFLANPPNNTLVHGGFQDAFLRSVEDVKREVISGLERFNSTNVLVTGHSLGAAIGVMNGVFLTRELAARGSPAKVKTQVFGLPRAGNSDWADFVEATIGADLVHMHLHNDPIPTVPPKGFLDYTHPAGEVFDSFSFETSTTNGTATRDGSTAVFCPGRENENCSLGRSLLTSSIVDHLGPYLTVDIGSFSCSL